MAIKSVKYFPEVDTLEHDDLTMPETKRVLLYGWDAKNLQKVRLNVNSDGALETTKTKMILDTATTYDVVYIGNAPRGSGTDDDVWEIMKIDKTGSDEIFTWAEGKWDDRVTLNYT